MRLLSSLRQRAARLRRETYALYLAARHPHTPWYAKLLVAGIVAYALSPVDLIPDFIPVLGYLDDLILLPLAIALALRLIPPAVLAVCRQRAAEALRPEAPTNRTAGIVVISLWLVLAVLGGYWLVRALGG